LRSIDRKNPGFRALQTFEQALKSARRRFRTCSKILLFAEDIASREKQQN
jgi:hypothetical protein